MSRTRVLQILKQGRIPCGRVGGKRLIPAVAITKFMRDRFRRESKALRERRCKRELKALEARSLGLVNHTHSATAQSAFSACKPTKICHLEVLDMKIKNRQAALRRICVPLGGCSLMYIYVTDKQLVRLNRTPVGKEVFLSDRYCQIGGSFWVIRTKDGLQYVPNPHGGSQEDIGILEWMLKRDE